MQGVLAPLQLLAMLASAVLLVRYLSTGGGWAAAAASVVVKTAFLYAIMITGSLWEKDVFGKYLFAPAFFWEDAGSFVAIALHTAYLAGLAFPFADHRQLAWLALVGYAAYAVNAFQFLLKLRAARLQEREERGMAIVTAPNPPTSPTAKRALEVVR